MRRRGRNAAMIGQVLAGGAISFVHFAIHSAATAFIFPATSPRRGGLLSAHTRLPRVLNGSLLIGWPVAIIFEVLCAAGLEFSPPRRVDGRGAGRANAGRK